MIIPSIDIIKGQAVQLIGGKELAIEAGCPKSIARQFSVAGEVAVIDLDAAMGNGNNDELIRSLCRTTACRVGGGIRSLEKAQRVLNWGARSIILGTAARVELLKKLPKERLIVALDAIDGEVVTHGWTTRTGTTVAEQMKKLRDYVSGFLVTFVEREGRMNGIAMDKVGELAQAAGSCRLTVAGGIRDVYEIAQLDRRDIDAQVGMAIYSGKMHLADAIAAPLQSDRADGLYGTVVVDESNRALGQCWSNKTSLRAAIESMSGVYWSRKRGLWKKGESSGNTQELLSIDVDCDRDTLRFRVRQTGSGFCHRNTTTCWGPQRGLPALASRLQERLREAPPGSYTQRLLQDPALLQSKLQEEAWELATADGPDRVAEEAADLVYFALVAMTRAKVDMAAVEDILDKRSLKIERRPGNAKRAFSAGAIGEERGSKEAQRTP